MWILLLLVFMFSGVTSGSAEDAVKITATEEKPVVDTNLEQMKKFMIDDQKAQQDVYKLKGEIEKTKLELEKHKMLRELAQLTGSETAGIIGQAGDLRANVVIKTIFCSEKIKEAVVDVGGREAVLKEGMAFQGAVVKQIDPQGVVFTRDGKDERIDMRK